MDRFLIPDEWLEDIKGIAAREWEGSNVTITRKALLGILARLDEAERRSAALKWIEPLLGQIRAVLSQAVNQLPLPDGPMLAHFRGIHGQMRELLGELEKLELTSTSPEWVTCPCGLTCTAKSRDPGGSHYGHIGPKNV